MMDSNWLAVLRAAGWYCPAGCGPGQGRATEREPCTPCPRNFYNPGGLRGECLPCPDGLVTISEGAAQCGELDVFHLHDKL
jgi:hypothetical protein